MHVSIYIYISINCLVYGSLLSGWRYLEFETAIAIADIIILKRGGVEVNACMNVCVCVCVGGGGGGGGWGGGWNLTSSIIILNFNTLRPICNGRQLKQI